MAWCGKKIGLECEQSKEHWFTDKQGTQAQAQAQNKSLSWKMFQSQTDRSVCWKIDVCCVRCVCVRYDCTVIIFRWNASTHSLITDKFQLESVNICERRKLWAKDQDRTKKTDVIVFDCLTWAPSFHLCTLQYCAAAAAVWTSLFTAKLYTVLSFIYYIAKFIHVNNNNNL